MAMRVRWRGFELPTKIVVEEETRTDTYAKFITEPFQRGFGITVGNGLRRVLLSSLEGAAVTHVKFEGVDHEYTAIPGVYEDVTDIILAIKRLRIRYVGTDPITCRISKSGKGPVTGADVQCPGDAEVVNKDLKLATLTLDREFNVELKVDRGRGYVPAEEHRDETEELGVIPVDSIYSPVHRVRYSIEATRVGKFTNYDRLVLEIWTDGTISPQMALTESAKIYRKHLNPFVMFEPGQTDAPVPGDPASSELHQKNREDDELRELLDRPLSDLELSVRARNCLDSANLQTLGELVSMSEAEVMKLKNLGKTSLTEIKNKLSELGLNLGMQV